MVPTRVRLILRGGVIDHVTLPQVTCDSHTDFKVKRSKVKVTGRGYIVAAT